MQRPVVPGYRFTAHASERMAQRAVSADEVLLVIEQPDDVEQAAGGWLINCQAQINGRLIRITVNDFTNEVVTVVTPGCAPVGSLFGWFSLGASLEARR